MAKVAKFKQLVLSAEIANLATILRTAYSIRAKEHCQALAEN